jgi:predicted aspartyl protease
MFFFLKFKGNEYLMMRKKAKKIQFPLIGKNFSKMLGLNYIYKEDFISFTGNGPNGQPGYPTNNN